MSNTFQKDLQRGLSVERKALQMINKKYPQAYMAEALKEYDIFIPEKNYSVEVKYDPMSNITGNFVVEIEFNGKPSALMTSTATYWLFYDDEEWFWIKPMEIISCIFLNNLRWVEFIGDGDTKSKKVFLIRKEILKNFPKKIENFALRQSEKINDAVQHEKHWLDD
jgi:hypothetical protein